MTRFNSLASSPNRSVAGAGDRFGQVEAVGVFGLAEVEAGVQLLQDHQLRSLVGCFADSLDAFLQIGLTIGAAGLLNQANDELIHGKTPFGSCMVTQCSEPCCRISGRQCTPIMARSGNACPTADRAWAS